MKRRLKIFLVIAILAGSLLLRFHNYTVYPQRGATSDEYTYSFLGVSLLKEGKPISWSYFGYENKTDLTIKGIYFPIVSPYFDHPPLYGLLVGGWALLFGQDTFVKIDLGTIRLVPIFLSLISSLLVFLIGNRLYNYKTGLWALLIYTTAAFFVMNSRVVVAENLLTTLFLCAVYLFSLFEKRLTIRKVVILGILAGLSFWTKVLGGVVFLSLLFMFLKERVQLKIVLIFTTIFLLFVLGFIGYGLYFGGDLFWKIQFAQSSRNIGPEALWNIITSPAIVNKIVFDGWFFFGLFSLFYGFSDYAKNKRIIVPSFLYFFLLLISLNKIGSSGWYFIPLFPFIALSIANLLVENLKKQNFLPLLFVIFIGLGEIQYLWEAPFGLSPSVFRLLSLLFFLPFLFSLFLKSDRPYRIIGNFWFYIFILGNIFMTYNYIHPS